MMVLLIVEGDEGSKRDHFSHRTHFIKLINASSMLFNEKHGKVQLHASTQPGRPSIKYR